jgi:hypothetical protein
MMLPVPDWHSEETKNLHATSSRSTHNEHIHTQNSSEHSFKTKMVDPADIQLNLNNDQASHVVQQNFPSGAQTMLTFKVEQSKVPEFFGQRGKDTISAIVFIRRIDDLVRTNNWNDTTTYTNVCIHSQGVCPWLDFHNGQDARLGRRST